MGPLSPYKNPIFIILLLTILLVAGCGQKAGEIPQNTVEKGVLDLERWDFEKHGTVKLEGDWEFYWMELLNPAELEDTQKQPGYMSVPLTWSKSELT